MTGTNGNLQDSSVTVVISRRVKPGCEAKFETFLVGVTDACSQFPGYLGSSIFRPAAIDDPEYRVIFKFDRLSNLRRWETSDERQNWFAQAEALTLCPPDVQVLTGLETWFTLPGKAAIVPPPRHKMALVTWLAVFPLITVISTVLQHQLLPLPLVLRVMAVTAIAVPTMTYVLMPQMTRLFAGWLYPSHPDDPTDPLEDTTPLTLPPSTAQPLPQCLSVIHTLPVELEFEPSSTAPQQFDEMLRT